MPMRLLPLILLSCMVLGAAEKKAPKKKPAPPAPPPVVESVKTDLYAEILDKGVLSKFLVEEELLLEKCKTSPRLYRNALVEIHQKRLDAVQQRHLWLMSMAGKIPTVDIPAWKQDLENMRSAIPVLQDAIKRLEDLPL